MKRRPSKSELRAELANKVQSFVEGGGEIRQCAMGESGLEDGKYNTRSFGFESGPQARTPVAGLLATIDARRSAAPKSAATPVKSRQRRRKKVIYDDFGEPLRWVWAED